MASVCGQSARHWPDRLRLPLRCDAARLAAELAALADDEWIAHFVTQNYDGDWSVIPLRGPAGATHPVMMIYSDPGATDFADTPFLARMPYARSVLAQFRCPLTSVRLMRLGPGSTIRPHRDHDLAAEAGSARIHLPVSGHAGVEFLLNGTPVPLVPGEAWYLRLSDPHSVVNRGAEERVNLVIDTTVDDWLADLLDAGD